VRGGEHERRRAVDVRRAYAPITDGTPVHKLLRIRLIRLQPSNSPPITVHVRKKELLIVFPGQVSRMRQN